MNSNTLLIIEDNEQNFYMMNFLLEKNGFNIIHADNGKDGIEMALKFCPLAILLDIQLPEMDGYAVARNLRRDPALAGTPIVAVTSYAMAGDREKVMEAGCDGYIEKPIDPDTFVSQIERHLPGRDRSRRE